jgi:cob(I)alamin adenosyltransferase
MCDPRIEAVGAVDELNAALGLACATAKHAFVRRQLPALQKDLVVLMGELATLPKDLPQYLKAGHARLTAPMVRKLDKLVESIEAQHLGFRGWAMPGSSLHCAALDLARAVCRRAERRVCALEKGHRSGNPFILVYLNRLSDLLWLMARAVEVQRVPGPTVFRPKRVRRS